MLSRQVSAREAQGKTNDREWVHTVLAYLKVYLENMGKELTVGTENKTEHVVELMASLSEAARHLTSGTLDCR